MKKYYANFEYIQFCLTKEDALSVSGAGDATENVESLKKVSYVKKQLDALSDENLISELKLYGAWDSEELSDRFDNENRIVWLAGCDIKEFYKLNNYRS